MSQQINYALSRLFDKHRIVFWYDAPGHFADSLNELALEGVDDGVLLEEVIAFDEECNEAIAESEIAQAIVDPARDRARMGPPTHDEGDHQKKHAAKRPREHFGLDPPALEEAFFAATMLLYRAFEIAAHPDEVEIGHRVGEDREEHGDEREHEMLTEGPTPVRDVDAVEYSHGKSADGQYVQSQEGNRHEARSL